MMVPIMITNAMRQELRKKGYDDAAINKMKPQEAWDKITDKKERVSSLRPLLENVSSLPIEKNAPVLTVANIMSPPEEIPTATFASERRSAKITLNPPTERRTAKINIKPEWQTKNTQLDPSQEWQNKKTKLEITPPPKTSELGMALGNVPSEETPAKETEATASTDMILPPSRDRIEGQIDSQGKTIKGPSEGWKVNLGDFHAVEKDKRKEEKAKEKDRGRITMPPMDKFLNNLTSSVLDEAIGHLGKSMGVPAGITKVASQGIKEYLGLPQQKQQRRSSGGGGGFLGGLLGNMGGAMSELLGSGDEKTSDNHELVQVLRELIDVLKKNTEALNKSKSAQTFGPQPDGSFNPSLGRPQQAESHAPNNAAGATGQNATSNGMQMEQAMQLARIIGMLAEVAA